MLAREWSRRTGATMSLRSPSHSEMDKDKKKGEEEGEGSDKVNESDEDVEYLVSCASRQEHINESLVNLESVCGRLDLVAKLHAKALSGLTADQLDALPDDLFAQNDAQDETEKVLRQFGELLDKIQSYDVVDEKNSMECHEFAKNYLWLHGVIARVEDCIKEIQHRHPTLGVNEMAKIEATKSALKVKQGRLRPNLPPSTHGEYLKSSAIELLSAKKPKLREDFNKFISDLDAMDSSLGRFLTITTPRSTLAAELRITHQKIKEKLESFKAIKLQADEYHCAVRALQAYSKPNHLQQFDGKSIALFSLRQLGGSATCTEVYNFVFNEGVHKSPSFIRRGMKSLFYGGFAKRDKNASGEDVYSLKECSVNLRIEGGKFPKKQH